MFILLVSHEYFYLLYNFSLKFRSALCFCFVHFVLITSSTPGSLLIVYVYFWMFTRIKYSISSISPRSFSLLQIVLVALTCFGLKGTGQISLCPHSGGFLLFACIGSPPFCIPSLHLPSFGGAIHQLSEGVWEVKYLRYCLSNISLFFLSSSMAGCRTVGWELFSCDIAFYISVFVVEMCETILIPDVTFFPF